MKNRKRSQSVRYLLHCCVSLFGLFVATGVHSLELQQIDFSMAQGDQTIIVLTFDEAPPLPTGYAIAQPARIALDLAGAQSGLASKYHALGSGTARDVTILEADDRLRVIVALGELVGYTTEIRGRTLVITVGRDLDDQQKGGYSEAGSETGRNQAVTGIDFRRGNDGAGRVIVSLSHPDMEVDIDQRRGNLVLTMPNASVASGLSQQLDVNDFATPVSLIDIFEEGSKALIEVKPIGAFDYLAYQADDRFILELKPAQEDNDPDNVGDGSLLYEGDQLSLNFQNIEIRAVLQIVADFADLNLVASDAVTGAITLRLKDVPWDQALDIVLRTNGLDKRVQGNVLLVAPAEDLANQERAALENKQEIAELAPLRTELIKVKYANAAEIVSLFSSAEDDAAEGSPGGMVSERGSVMVDERTNSIILTETQSRINQLRALLDQLDIPVRQVMIEARIVKASDSFKREAGIRWGTSGEITWGDSPNGITYGSTIETLGGTPSENLIVDLGTGSGKTSGIAFGLVNNDLLLDLELQLFESEGIGETVSRPTIITSDKSTASVNSGSQIPYQSDTGGGATSTSFINATVGLTVTPQITPDDRIILDLDVTNNSRGDPTPGGPPAIDTESIQTQVIVNDGETLVLGGLYQTRTDLIQLKTPVLGDLPLIGRMFRNSARTNDKDELLIFITPKIIRDSGKSVR